MKETRVAVRAAEEAGKILTRHFGKRLEIRDKGRGVRSLVTQVDMESNRKIISILRKEFPDYGILSEETPEKKGEGGRWIIDPLDGTHNFVYGIPIFGVSIALEREGKVVLGVINLPLEKRMFVAERGKGGLMNGKRIKVSGRGMKEAMVIFGAGKEDPVKKRASGIMKELLLRVSDVRMLGAATVHYIYVAMGRAEVYIDMQNKPWDNAAGFLLVEEAGGRVSDFSGRGWDANTVPLVASNNRVHEEILRIVNQ